MKLGVLTSVDTRHRYFVNALAARFDIVAVGYEKTGYCPANVEPFDLSADEAAIVAEHFAERARQEVVFFGRQSDFVVDRAGCRVMHIQPGRLNSRETCDLIEDAGADTIVVFGTNLIRAPLLERFAGRIVNLHLGLSPYYRGTATNFYPLLNEEPEYVGATIHLIDPGIDSGPILAHARPVIVAGDRPHSIGCKAIQSAIDKLVVVLPEWHRGDRQAVPQWQVPAPRVYLRKDYHPRHIVELYGKLDRGLIRRYVEGSPKTASRLRLVD